MNTYQPTQMWTSLKDLIYIREKAIAGEEIEAIRLLRATFVIGVKEAKELVEAMQHGEDVDMSRS